MRMIFGTIVGMVTLSTGCFFGVKGSGNVRTEPRPVTAFDEITLASVVDAEVTTGPAAQVELTGDDNLLPLISTKVVGNRLEIRSHENMRPSRHITAKIVVPALNKLSLSGTGDARLDDLRTDALVVDVSGTGDVTLNHVDSDALKVDISGTGEVEGTGHARRLDVDVSGTGDLKFARYTVEQARVLLSGTGDVDVTVNQTLEANLNGTGDITYGGNPSVRSKVSGAGDLKHR